MYFLRSAVLVRMSLVHQELLSIPISSKKGAPPSVPIAIIGTRAFTKAPNPLRYARVVIAYSAKSDLIRSQPAPSPSLPVTVKPEVARKF